MVTDHMTLKDDLQATREWLATHEWAQGIIRDEANPSYCVMESACAAMGDDPFDQDEESAFDPALNRRYTAINDALYDVIKEREPHYHFVTGWNDEPSRTKDEVLALLDQTIERAS